MFSQTLTADNTTENNLFLLSPQGSESKTQHTTARTKKFLASHRNMHGPAVAQFIKNHSLGQRTFQNQDSKTRDGSQSQTNTTNVFKDGRRSVSTKNTTGPVQPL